MAFLSGSNPVLTRELRTSLRSVRSFILLALYVGILGAVVLSAFPVGSQLDMRSDGGQAALKIFNLIFWGQTLLILALLPALATGSLAQERERQTLEPLLLSPLSPLQIVWGKAGGVLSLVCLLLVSTIPLTSLCFLLGGVDAGILVMGYSTLLGLAIFTTCLGMYCSARWPGSTQAMLLCYLMLPPSLLILTTFGVLGTAAAGLVVLGTIHVAINRWWQAHREDRWARKLGAARDVVRVLALSFFYCTLLVLCLVFRGTIGYSVLGILFLLSYFVLSAQWAMLQTAKELMQHRDPRRPLKEKVSDFKEEWIKALTTEAPGNERPAAQIAPGAPAAAPAPTFGVPLSQVDEDPRSSRDPQNPAASSIAIFQSPEVMTAPKPVMASADNEALASFGDATASRQKKTYGVAPFIPDKLNPIFAREMRAAFFGKFEYLFKFSYIAIIATQLFLLFVTVPALTSDTYSGFLSDPRYTQEAVLTMGRMHFLLLMIVASWLGARSIAPEREGQTLMHLFTLPMLPEKILKGKLCSVLALTGYALVLAAIPLFLLTTVGGLPAAFALSFLAVEIGFGFLAATWGIFCSFHFVTVRRAVSFATGGVLVLVYAQWLTEVVLDLFPGNSWQAGVRDSILFQSLPLQLMRGSDNVGIMSEVPVLLPVGIVVTIGVALMTLTAHNFRRLSLRG